jgi:hypothetical protein
MNRHAHSWRPDDVVSACGGTLTGKVVRFGTAVKVQYGTPRKWDWPDGWVLGVGPREFICLECSQPYRTDETQADFCPVCIREHELAHAGGGTRKVGGPAPASAAKFYAKYRPQPAPVDDEAAARQRAKDESESPF